MTLLVLSGTSEGRSIAEALHTCAVPVIASLAGATRSPRAQGVPMRLGGFGGDDGFARYLRDEKISAVLDATHPFAARITWRSARICQQMGVPYCLFLRPPWQPGPQDRWTLLADEEAARAHIAPGARVFLATGRQTLHRFATLHDCTLICRQIDPPDAPFPFANGRFLIGRPPFSVQDEIALFRKLGIDWLIVKNAGGAASYSKLDAARRLELRVGMIARPEMPDAPQAHTLEQAIDWGLRHG